MAAADAPSSPPRQGSSSGGIDDDVESSRMTLAQHLEELRSRVIKASVAVVIAISVLWIFRQPVSQFVQQPYRWAISWLNEDLREIRAEQVAAGLLDAADVFEPGYPEELRLGPEQRISDELNLLGIGTRFFFKLKICFWLAFFVAGPIVLWQMWAFIAAGLYRTERHVVYRYFPASLLLFAAGVSFGFLVMVPYAIYFLEKDGLGLDNMQITTAAEQYLQFLKGLSLAVGAIFQLPVLQVVLARTGLVDPHAYVKYRPHMVVGSLLVAAIITPPDPVTQLLLAGPAIVLYEIGGRIARLAWKPPLGPPAPVPNR